MAEKFLYNLLNYWLFKHYPAPRNKLSGTSLVSWLRNQVLRVDDVENG